MVRYGIDETNAGQYELPYCGIAVGFVRVGLHRGCPPMQLTEQLLAVSTAGFSTRHIVLVRQSIKRKAAPGKTLSLFAGEPDIKEWRYGAMVTSLSLPSVEEWHSYRGWAGCENRILEVFLHGKK